MSAQHLPPFALSFVCFLLPYALITSEAAVVESSSDTIDLISRKFLVAVPVIYSSNPSSAKAKLYANPFNGKKNSQPVTNSNVKAPEPTTSKPITSGQSLAPAPKDIVQNSFIFSTGIDCAVSCRSVVQSALFANQITISCAVNNDFVNIGTVHLGFIRCAESPFLLPVSRATIEAVILPALEKSNIKLISVENDRTFTLQ